MELNEETQIGNSQSVGHKDVELGKIGANANEDTEN